MADLIIENTGVDDLYPIEGVPISEVSISMSEIYKKIARISSLAVQSDPYFADKTSAQRLFSELHGEGDRITEDFLEDGAEDILPVFSPLQRWIPDVEPGPRYEFNTAGEIIYRWQNMDTRHADYKLNYTSATLVDIRIDVNIVANVEKHLKNALQDFVLKELYRAIGYDKKYVDYNRSYERNRQYVAFWAKSDTSLQR